jgi:hypothetical protein
MLGLLAIVVCTIVSIEWYVHIYRHTYVKKGSVYVVVLCWCCLIDLSWGLFSA